MIDRRELILERLLALLTPVPGAVATYRNRGELPEKDGVLDQDKLPAVVLLDGDETIRTNVRGLSLTGMPPAVFTLLPQVFVILPMRDHLDNNTYRGVAAPVGPALSAFRVSVINAVLNDDTLVAMVGTNGQVEYRGCATDLKTGSTIGTFGAQMQMHFAISYVLSVKDLN